MSSFNANIPTITDYMLISQTQIRANFQAIDRAFAENHVQMNMTLQGMHTILNFRQQSGDPTTLADQTALYTKLVPPVTGPPSLFFRPENNQTPIQLTYPVLSTGLQSTNPDVYLARQQSFVAGPFVFYSGIISGVVQNDLITLTPSSTLIYVGLMIYGVETGQDLNSFITACPTNIAANNFRVQFQTGLAPQRISYIAIGI